MEERLENYSHEILANGEVEGNENIRKWLLEKGKFNIAVNANGVLGKENIWRTNGPLIQSVRKYVHY